MAYALLRINNSMNGKALAAILAIIGVITVMFNGPKTEVSDFQAWKSKFGVTYESLFE